jgi:alkylation response protein AidB-like acyl-CoA dehydrogenase
VPIAVTEQQRAIADSIRRWAADADPVVAVRALEPGGVAATGTDRGRRMLGDLAGLGLFGLALPCSAGGLGAGAADLASALEPVTAALVPGPVMPTLLAGLLLAPFADRPAIGDLLAAIGAGTATVAVAFGAGTLVATRGPGSAWRVSGRVGPVLGAGATSHLLLGAIGSDGPRWFVLPATGAQLTARTPVDFSRPLADVALSEVTVDPAQLIVGPERFAGIERFADIDEAPENLRFGGRVRDVAAMLAAVEAAVVADWCVATAASYAAVRRQFGRPIGAFQAVKHLCAGMLCRAERAAAVARDATVAHDRAPDEFPLAVAAAAAIALDAGVDNAKDCVQVLGGIGFTWEHDAHLYLRRAVALRQLLGTGGYWRGRAADLAVAGLRRPVRGPAAPPRAAGSPGGAPPADRGGAPRASAGQAIAGWAVPTIVEHGTAAQRARFEEPSRRGEIVWCQLFSEPEAGSDLAGLRTRAVRVPGGWRLSGQKVWSSLAQRADWAICLARTDPAVAKHRGLTYFLVDMTDPGIEVRPLRELTGRAVFNEVFLDDVFVADDCVVGAPGDGWRLARATLAHERVAMGGSSLGEDVERLVDVFVAAGRGRDAGMRDQLGGLVVDKLALSLLDADADASDASAADANNTNNTNSANAGAASHRAAAAKGAGAAVRKVIGVAHRQAVAEVALAWCGPDGSTVDGDSADPVHQFLLTRCLSIAGGTTQILLTLIGERALGLPREPVS